MSTDIVCIKENSTIIQAAAQMRKCNIGSLPVCDDTGHIKGILTDRDIVIRALSEYADGTAGHLSLKDIKVKDVMSLNPVTVSPDTSIHDAALNFAFHKIRRLPVTEASGIVGMLSLGDVAVKPVFIDEAGDALSSISLTDDLQR
ncbi:MAG: CBS domain-containing protein [Bacillota bacterium]|nr:CBS domain-containing protein [Bacillota bacterium]